MGPEEVWGGLFLEPPHHNRTTNPDPGRSRSGRAGKENINTSEGADGNLPPSQGLGRTNPPEDGSGGTFRTPPASM